MAELYGNDFLTIFAHWAKKLGKFCKRFNHR